MSQNTTPTEAMVAALKSIADQTEKDGATHFGMTVDVARSVAERIEALVRLTAAQKAEIESLSQFVESIGDPDDKAEGDDALPVVLSVEECPDYNGNPDIDGALIQTRSGKVIIVADRWLSVWESEDHFRAGDEKHRIAIVTFDKQKPTE